MKSDANFYWWSAYFMAQPGRWAGLKSGLRFFGDRTTIHILDSLEEILKKRDHPRSLQNFDVSADDLNNDPKLMSALKPLYDNLHAAASLTHQIIAAYIRMNPNEFVQIAID